MAGCCRLLGCSAACLAVGGGGRRSAAGQADRRLLLTSPTRRSGIPVWPQPAKTWIDPAPGPPGENTVRSARDGVNASRSRLCSDRGGQSAQVRPSGCPARPVIADPLTQPALQDQQFRVVGSVSPACVATSPRLPGAGKPPELIQPRLTHFAAVASLSGSMRGWFTVATGVCVPPGPSPHLGAPAVSTPRGSRSKRSASGGEAKPLWTLALLGKTQSQNCVAPRPGVPAALRGQRAENRCGCRPLLAPAAVGAASSHCNSQAGRIGWATLPARLASLSPLSMAPAACTGAVCLQTGGARQVQQTSGPLAY